MFPIFTAVDLDDMMVETTGRYRWEICRKIQGVHWNDIRDKSLTAEYCDYIQFYKKNHDLSTEAKEKIKSALLRGKNNYREVFVKDYQNWREELKSNPMYQNAWQKYDILITKKIQRIKGVYDKYQKAGGKITDELKDNLEYYMM